MKFISTYVAAARGFNKRVPPFKPTLYPLSAAGLGVQPSNIMDIKSSKLPGNSRIAVIATPGRSFAGGTTTAQFGKPVYQQQLDPNSAK
jgi:hypothetical protein